MTGIGIIDTYILVKLDIYFQDINFDLTSHVIQQVINKLIGKGLTDEEIKEEENLFNSTPSAK